MTRTEYENINIGDMLFRDDRDPVKVKNNHVSGFYVVDMVYNDDIQDYEPSGSDYLLTTREVMTFRA